MVFDVDRSLTISVTLPMVGDVHQTLKKKIKDNDYKAHGVRVVGKQSSAHSSNKDVAGNTERDEPDGCQSRDTGKSASDGRSTNYQLGRDQQVGCEREEKKNAMRQFAPSYLQYFEESAAKRGVQLDLACHD